MLGNVKFYNGVKGFGFISCDDGRDVFIGSRVLRLSGVVVRAGDRIEFDVTPGTGGKDQAERVSVVTRAEPAAEGATREREVWTHPGRD